MSKDVLLSIVSELKLIPKLKKRNHWDFLKTLNPNLKRLHTEHGLQ